MNNSPPWLSAVLPHSGGTLGDRHDVTRGDKGKGEFWRSGLVVFVLTVRFCWLNTDMVFIEVFFRISYENATTRTACLV